MSRKEVMICNVCKREFDRQKEPYIQIELYKPRFCGAMDICSAACLSKAVDESKEVFNGSDEAATA